MKSAGLLRTHVPAPSYGATLMNVCNPDKCFMNAWHGAEKKCPSKVPKNHSVSSHGDAGHM